MTARYALCNYLVLPRRLAEQVLRQPQVWIARPLDGELRESVHQRRHHCSQQVVLRPALQWCEQVCDGASGYATSWPSTLIRHRRLKHPRRP